MPCECGVCVECYERDFDRRLVDATLKHGAENGGELDLDPHDFYTLIRTLESDWGPIAGYSGGFGEPVIVHSKYGNVRVSVSGKAPRLVRTNRIGEVIPIKGRHA